MSRAIIIVGGTGCGKTTYSKKLLSKVHKDAILVHDTNAEYKDIYPYPFNPDLNKFLLKVEGVEKAVVLIEDATAFLSNRGQSELLKRLLVAKRHQGNTYILLFHSFRAVPKYIVDLSTDIVIFFTNDPPDLVQQAYQNEAITKAFLEVKKEAENHPFFKEKWSKDNPPPPGVTPPYRKVKLY